MRDRKILIIGIIIVLLIIGIIVLINSQKNKNEEAQVTEANYNEETGMYTVTTSDGRNISSTDNGSLQIYIDDPDYKINPTDEYSQTEDSMYGTTENTSVYDEESGQYIDIVSGAVVE